MQFLYVADREHGNIVVFSLAGDVLSEYKLADEFGPIYAVEVTEDAVYAVSFPLGPGLHGLRTTTCSPFLVKLSLYQSEDKRGTMSL